MAPLLPLLQKQNLELIQRGAGNFEVAGRKKSFPSLLEAPQCSKALQCYDQSAAIWPQINRDDLVERQVAC
jgi:hypothetical protein